MDLSAISPTLGLGALLLYTLQYLWRDAGDRRKHEAELRSDFARERAALRAECAQDRAEDRAEVAELRLEVARLRGELETRR